MMPVLTRDGFIEEFDPEKIQKSLELDVEFARQIGYDGNIDTKEIRKIVKRVTNKLIKLGIDSDYIITSDTIRGLTVSELLARGEKSLAKVVEIVGLRTRDLENIILGKEDIDNANLQPNPETTHKRAADELFKKYYLSRMPSVAKYHIRGDIHIHDLEYFGTRPFCADHDLRYFFYYGLMPDGKGNKASVSGPAMHPEVAILHAVKALSAAQTNFSGGQGFYNFLTFLAPYLEGLSYDKIKQLMQMFVYEMTQMMVARGGQVVFSSVQLTPGVPAIWRDRPIVCKGRVWNGEQAPRRTYGEFEREVRLAFEALMDVMLEGDYLGKPFYFPKPEIAIEPDFVDESTWELPGPDGTKSYKELYLKACELAAKFGTPYFDNMLPAYRGHSKGGIACYQCLPKEELVPVINPRGEVEMLWIDMLYDRFAKDGVEQDQNGVEFAKCVEEYSTPSVDFDRSRVVAKAFSGVMRKYYTGDILEIILVSGRRIRVTPDHPCYVCRDGKYARMAASHVSIGDMLPVMVRGLLGEIRWEPVSRVMKREYNGYVYDLVDVADTHCFSNSMGIVVFNCCAYNFSIDPYKDKEFNEKMDFVNGKHFSMGSMQVVTLNLPRAAYRVSNYEDPERRYEAFIDELCDMVDVAVKVFEIKREWIDKQIAAGRLPFVTQTPIDPVTREKGTPEVDLNSWVYTIGIVGMNETVQVLTGYQLHEHDNAVHMAEKIINDLKMYIVTEYGSGIALARTPAETVVQRFAVLDLMDKRYSNIARRYVKGDVDSAIELCKKGIRDLPIYYTNGCMVTYSVGNLFDRIAIEHRFFPLVDGGNILHIFLGESNSFPESILELVMRIAKKTLTGYFAITKDLTICRDCGSVDSGLLDKCSRCGSQNVDHISRITGYLSAVSGWNAAKKQELKDRSRVEGKFE